MNGRLILAIISTLLEEAALAVIVLLGLPYLGIRIPLAGLVALMAVWGAFSVFTYRMGSRALRRKPVVGLPDMTDSKGKVASLIAPEGKVVSLIAPEGLVRIKGELWVAESESGEMSPGEDLIVVGQDGLKLIVRKSSTGDLKATE